MKKRKLNFLMVAQWFIFMPILLPMAAISGALEGVIRMYDQAKADILNLENGNNETNELEHV